MKRTTLDHILSCFSQADRRKGQESNVQDMQLMNGTYTTPKNESMLLKCNEKHETMLQKYNENARLTEELLRRIAALEEKMDSCITCRIITKV